MIANRSRRRKIRESRVKMRRYISIERIERIERMITESTKDIISWKNKHLIEDKSSWDEGLEP